MRLRAAVRRALLVLLTALLAIPTGVIAAPTAAAARACDNSSGSTPRAVAYAYDAGALLSSQSAAVTYVRGSPPGPEAVSWGRLVAVVCCCSAANTAEAAGGGVVRHYTTNAAAQSISNSGTIEPGLSSGRTWLTPDRYASGAEARARLALNKTPDGYFEIPMCRVQCPSGPSRVEPFYGQPGGGTEITTRFPIDVTDLPFIKFE